MGIGTDGCSVMASKICGAVSTIQNTATQAVRCPCFSHALNLSLARSSTVQSVRNSVGTIKDVVAFFNASAKRNNILKRITGKQLQGLCETRWVERHDAVLLFCSELAAIVNALTVITNWSESDSASKASTLKHALCCCEFIVTIFCLSDVLSLTLGLSRKLQNVSIDFCAAKAAVVDVIAVLSKRRDMFEHFDSIFTTACNEMEVLDVPVVQPRITNMQRNRPNPPATTPNEFYRRAVYLPLLDAVTSDLRSRFSDDVLNKLDSLSYFIPSFVVGPDRCNIPDLYLQYKACLEQSAGELRLRSELDLWKQKWSRVKDETPNATIPSTAAEGLAACDRDSFPTIHALLTIMLCMPVSTASAERSFSTLRRLKTWLRSRIGEQRLLGLALLNVHRDIPVSVDSVIDRFAKSKKRFLDFVI